MITILGATGFVGTNLIKKLVKYDIPYFAPLKNEPLTNKDLGDVIFCIGLTADAKYKPHETIEAHVIKLQEVIKHCNFDSLTYLSSTRLYIHSSSNTEECSLISTKISDPFDLFNLTKLLAESLLINTTSSFKSVRLSNVVGDDFTSENFITSLVKDAVLKKKIVLRTTLDSAKDYIFIDDVVDIVLQIAMSKKATGIYNVGYGANCTNELILKEIESITNIELVFTENIEKIIFPVINIDRIKEEFDFKPSKNIIELLPTIIRNYKQDIIKK